MATRLAQQNGIRELTREEDHELFEQEARERLHMNGDEFKQR